MLPVMNLFSILIPFLVTIVVFQKMAIVDVNLPETSDQAKGGTVTTSSLSLVISISEQNLNIHSATGSLPPIVLKEYWSVKCAKELNSVDYLADDIRKGRKEFLCANGSRANKHDIAEIRLYSLNKNEEDQGVLRMAVYNSKDSVFLNKDNEFLTELNSVARGEPVSTLGGAGFYRISQAGSLDIKLAPLSAYDELEKLLRDIASRYADADDISDITVVASDDIAFDKIIQVMDRARETGFTNISLAKLAI
jgi:biopolymer transport protein ExbD